MDADLGIAGDGIRGTAVVQGRVDSAPTYLDSFPLRASVYLSAKWDNKGYLRGVTCTVRSVLLLPM